MKPNYIIYYCAMSMSYHQYFSKEKLLPLLPITQQCSAELESKKEIYFLLKDVYQSLSNTQESFLLVPFMQKPNQSQITPENSFQNRPIGFPLPQLHQSLDRSVVTRTLHIMFLFFHHPKLSQGKMEKEISREIVEERHYIYLLLYICVQYIYTFI